MNPASIESLRKLASMAPAPSPPKPMHQAKPTSTTAEGDNAYAKTALEGELAKVRMASPGTRNNQLNKSAFALGQLIGGGVLSEWEVTSELERAALGIGLEAWEVRATIRSGIDAGLREPRGVPESTSYRQSKGRTEPPPPEQRARHKQDKQDGSDTPSVGIPGLVCLADVKSEHVLWLWRGRVPLSKLTILDGDPGLGKSMMTCDLAARVSVGGSMPDGERGDLTGPAGVVLLSAEDGLADTIRPRLDAAGADCARIAALTHVVDQNGLMKAPSVADLREIERAIVVTEARLIVIDPVVAYLPENTRSHNDQDVRRVLSPLAELAERTGVAVLMLRHLNKAPGGNPLYRGGGSIAFVGAVRSGLLAAQDPEDETGQRRIIASTKSNLAPAPQAIAYHIETADNGAAYIVWDGVTGHTAASLLTSFDAEEKSALADAVAFLKDLLGDGECAASDVEKEAKSASIAIRTLHRAKSTLGVMSQRRGAYTDARWVWVLPEKEANIA